MTDQFIKPVKAAKKPSTKKPSYKSSRIFFVLDMSGSMNSVWDDTIGGFNAFLEEQKAVKMPTTMTVVLFDTHYELLYNNVPIEHVEPLTRKTYTPRGGTALYDAIGRTIATNRKSKKSEKTVFAILTDGEENSSREFHHSTIKKMIEEVQGENWEVLFVGANIDAAAVGGGMGVNLSKTASFKSNGKGMADVMKTAAYASNVSRGMNYGWMGTATAAAGLTEDYFFASNADGTRSVNLNSMYEMVDKGIDEHAKTQVEKK